MIYLDSSALLKLVFEEEESSALSTWLNERHGSVLVSSDLARVEVLRATRRIDPVALREARQMVSQLDLVPLTGGILDAAGELDPAPLRSLDAIDLACALSLAQDLDAFVAYDARLTEAAASLSLPVARPA